MPQSDPFARNDSILTLVHAPNTADRPWNCEPKFPNLPNRRRDYCVSVITSKVRVCSNKSCASSATAVHKKQDHTPAIDYHIIIHIIPTLPFSNFGYSSTGSGKSHRGTVHKGRSPRGLKLRTSNQERSIRPRIPCPQSPKIHHPGDTLTLH